MQTNLDGAIILSREELYDRVWATPIVHLAEEFGLSGTGLAKICGRHRVPRPGRGYWAKKARGHAVSTPDLPPMDVAELRTVTIRPERPGALRPTVPPEPEPPEPRTPVGERLVSPHPLVVRTKAALEREKPDKYGLAWAHRDAKALNVAVAPASVGRALRIMDALVKSLEASGYSVEVGESRFDRRPCTFVAPAPGDQIRFYLREATRREELKRDANNRWAERFRYVPTGRLGLHIDTWGLRGELLRRGWTDGKTLVVENCLDEFVKTIGIIAQRHGELRRLQAIEAQRRAEEEKARIAREEAMRKEQARLKRLEADADAWHKSQRVRAYVEAVRSEATARPDGADAGPVQAWLEWASAHADSLDPLTAGKPPPWATSGPPGEPAAPRNP